jgi:hypothetical protein
MKCERCGGPMMLETVIKLRRGFLGFRETRSPGAYCASCQIGVPIEGCRSIDRPAAWTFAARGNTRGLVPSQSRIGLSHLNGARGPGRQPAAR